jgi:hypothetical protein
MNDIVHYISTYTFFVKEFCTIPITVNVVKTILGVRVSPFNTCITNIKTDKTGAEKKYKASLSALYRFAFCITATSFERSSEIRCSNSSSHP